MRHPRSLAATFGAVLFALVASAAAGAQSAPGPLKALVYCPVGVDATGCERVITALADMFAGVDRGYDGTSGTLDLRTADINHYAVILVPSLADGAEAKPYALLRDAAVAPRLKSVLTGRVAVWSGTPDQGDANRDAKNTLIRNLATWASGPYATSGVTGAVVLQDLSDGVGQRYGWLAGISPITVQADSSLDVYETVEAVSLVGTEIIKNGDQQLAYAAIASFGLHLPAEPPGILAGALGGASNRQIVLVTYHGGGDGVASVKTDRDDYAPGDTVTITGSGWEPRETVFMVLHEDPLQHENRTLTATANDSGNFVHRDFAPERHDIGVKFLLTAVGQTSGRSAQTAFTDAPKVGTLSVGAQSPDPVTAGSSATFPITITRGDNANDAFNVTLTVTSGLPSDATYVFSPTVVSFTKDDGKNASKLATLTVTPSAATATSSWTFTVRGTRNDNTSDFATGPGTLKVTVPPCTAPTISVPPANATKTVGEGVTFSVTASGTAPLSYQWRKDNINIGGATGSTYSITALTMGDAGSYSVVVTNGCGSVASNTATLTVTRANPAVAIIEDSPDASVVGQAYAVTFTVAGPSGAATPTGNVTISDGATSCTGTLTSGAGSCLLTSTNAGSKTLTATYAGDDNYNSGTSAGASHQVNQAATAVAITSHTPDPSDVGQAVAVSFTVSVVSPGSGIPTGAVTVSDGTASCTAAIAAGAGSCSLTPASAGTKTLTVKYAGDANFFGSSASVSHQVKKGGTMVEITADTPDPSVFGNAFTVSFAVSAVAPASGTPTGNVTVSDGTATCTASVAAGTCSLAPASAGAKTLVATYEGDNNFSGSTSAGAAHQVNKATATVTLVEASLSHTYDGTAKSAQATTIPPGLTVVFTYTAVGQTATAPPTSVAPTDAGTYTVTATVVDDNYQGSTPGTLTIAKATPKIMWAAPQTITHGTSLSSTQLNAEASVPGTFSYDPAAGTVLAAGTHELTASFTPTDAANYNGATAKVYLTVTKATPVFSNLSSPTITYGESSVSLTGKLTAGAVAPTGSVVITLGSGGAAQQQSAPIESDGSFSGSFATATLPASATPYPIAYTFAENANFNSASDNSTSLTVNKAPLTVRADDATRMYGDANPAFTVRYDGFVLGQNESALGGTLAFSTTAEPSSPVGNYAVTPSGLTSDNYAITFADGTLTITKAALTVTADNASREYGEPNPTFTGTITGQKNGETFTATYGTVATPASEVGVYPITITEVQGATLGNYNVVENAATLTITKAPATITLTNLSHTYDGTAKAATATTTPVGLSGVTITYAGASTPPVNAGSYAVVASLSHKNYDAPDAMGTLLIAKATPVIAWSSPAPITYGTPLSATQLNATASFNGAPLTGTFAYTPAAGTVLGAGTRALSATFSPSDATNFEGATTAVELVVNKATPTISWSPADLTNPTPLGAAQLNAIATGVGGAGDVLSGRYDYKLPDGTVVATRLSDGTIIKTGTLAPGLNTPLTVEFTPSGTDATNYTSASATAPETFDVLNSIDILPGSNVNTISLSNTKSDEIPVAVLGTATFDARTIITLTVRVGNGSDPDAPVNTNNNGTLRASITDVNADGRADLMVYIKKAALTGSPDGDLVMGTDHLMLRADLTTGKKIRGVDKVTVTQ
ncbi:MAG: MBG domain-containing protein [Gemmatimonadota bacterium]|nr:MBG domain-containing protein [Gemmatimonadota bacterium]